MKIYKIGIAAAFVVTLTGCAHPLMIGPDISKIERPASAEPVKKNVAYYIADELRNREVTTPGGGGDRVSYYPYRDFETAFYKMLSNVFGDVVKVNSTNVEAVGKNNVVYVITPKLVTDSSSPSPFTWPPTKFTADLTCDITDASGKPVVSKTVNGVGNAEFAEFKSDFSLSGKLAVQDALLKMQQSLLDTPELRK